MHLKLVMYGMIDISFHNSKTKNKTNKQTNKKQTNEQKTLKIAYS